MNKGTSSILIVVYLVLLAVGSLVPCRFSSDVVAGGDKVIHFLFYVPLGILLRPPKTSSSLSLALTFRLGVGTLYGFFMELLQAAVPGRTASLYDGIANFLGVAVGISVGVLHGWIRGRMEN